MTKPKATAAHPLGAAAGCALSRYELVYEHGQYVIKDQTKPLWEQVVSTHQTLQGAEHALDHLKGSIKWK
jgi:hypothetical protein